jgi:decaprenylphospho-beta-D-erythro-pentofuranosid-2-ulose 2-reductase
MKITILGATSDVAEALIYKFAPLAEKLHLTARNPANLTPLVADLRVRELCKNVETHHFDAQLLDFQQLTHLANDTDLLIVAVGYLGEQPKAEQNDAEATQILNTNFTGLARAMNVFVEKMAAETGDFSKTKKGIIGISSVAGARGRASNYFYGAAKAGFTAYLSGVRHRLFAKKINVLTVLPGFMDTKMTAGLPLPKPLTATPEQAAEQIFRGWQKGRRTIYVLPIWRLIMLIIRELPEMIFLKLKL